MDCIRRLLEIASFSAVIIGIPLFFLQSYLDRIRAADDRTLQYVTLFQSDTLINARREVQRPWTTMNIKELGRAGGARADLDKIVSLEIQDSESLRAAMFAITDFFDTLAICVNHRICSSRMVESYFIPYAERFWCLYGGFLIDMRAEQGLDVFGEGLFQLVGSRDKCFSGE